MLHRRYEASGFLLMILKQGSSFICGHLKMEGRDLFLSYCDVLNDTHLCKCLPSSVLGLEFYTEGEGLILTKIKLALLKKNSPRVFSFWWHAVTSDVPRLTA